MIKFSNAETNITVQFPLSCVNTLMKFRQIKDTNESGGLLFAKPVIGDRIEICFSSTPSKFDVFGPRFFKHNKRSSQKTISKQFAKGLAYVGDWHTHAEAQPSPSMKDINTIKTIYLESDHCMNYLMILILGSTLQFSKSYVGITDGNKVYKLNPS